MSNSGYAAVVADNAGGVRVGDPVVVAKGFFKASGSNYLAEMAALLSAMVSVHPG